MLDAAHPLVDSERPPSLSLVLSLILIQSTIMSGFSVFETITSRLAQENFGWDVQECNFLFTCGGCAGLFAYVMFVVASRWIQDRWLMVNALVLCSIGFILCIDWQQLEWIPVNIHGSLSPYRGRFITGYMLVTGGVMTGRPVTFAIYSKLIASKFQGKYLGYMVAGGSAARMIGPFAAIAIYYMINAMGPRLLVIFGSVLVFHLAGLMLVIVQWYRLLPKEYGKLPVRQIRVFVSV